MEIAEINQAERDLVDRLKTLCDASGKEFDPTKSAPIFHELAKIYQNKSDHKKLNAIRSAALFNAAIVRNIRDKQIRHDLQAFCSDLLVKADAVKRNADLVSLAATLKHGLFDFRKVIGECFNELQVIPCGVANGALRTMEKETIMSIQKLQDEVTRRYTELMKFVSDTCIEIMGTPPCKYAVVGMGSLARSEITPYSDFEHIILLDNEYAQIKDKRLSLRYFKWFSTVFHVILLNLGETMIPTVAIPTLNGGLGFRFYDTYTPNGVSFDGLLPFECKFPLGRQPTENRPWKSSLIKPVDEMVLYLSTENELKEGYHLADIISKTCFVAGQQSIYDEYQEKSGLCIKENDKATDFTALRIQIKNDLQNLNIVSQYLNVFQGFQNLHIKRVLYRSVTIFVAALGRLYSLKESSSFKIINKLEELRVCSKEVAHELRFAVAVACTVRGKYYKSKERHCDIFMEGSKKKDIIDGLINIVGKHSFLSLVKITYSLQNFVKNLFVNERHFNEHRLQNIYWEQMIGMNEGLFEMGLNEI